MNTKQRKIPYLNFVLKIGNHYKPKIFKNKEAINRLLKGKILINQSEKILTNEEIEALCLGLNFIPTYHRTTSEETIAIERWKRDLNLSLQFLGRESNSKRGWLSKLIKSEYNPEQPWNNDPEFLKKTKQLCTPKIIESKTTPVDILTALRELKNSKDIHIMKSDKGRNIVIWPVVKYNKEALRQLQDQDTYKEMTEVEYIRRTKQILDECTQLSENLLALGHINDREDKAICNRLPKGSYIYFLPKTHKEMNKKTGTFPGRPIVATFTSTTYLLDKFITEITKELLYRIPGSLIDTKHLLELLPKHRLPGTTRLITADVNSLYPSIPWVEGIEAATDFYKDNFQFLQDHAIDNQRYPPPTPRLFKAILELVLTNSIIIYKDERYFHQIKGTAMGCCISVYFANCYMYSITKHLINNPPKELILFERFIDDILIITTTTENETIKQLFDSISNASINYEIAEPSKSHNFLDLTISLNDLNLVDTSPYWKPTASGSYLHPASNHPQHIIRSVPYAQFLRLNRNSSTAEKFIKAAQRLKKELRNMEYNKKLIESSYQKALSWKKPSKKRDTANSHKLMAIYSNNIDWKHTKTLMDLTYISIITQYHLENTPLSIRQASYLNHKNTTIVHRTLPNINGNFSKEIKQPRYRL